MIQFIPVLLRLASCASAGGIYGHLPQLHTAVGTETGIVWQHRVAGRTAGVPLLVTVEKRFARQLRTAAGAEGSICFDDLPACFADLGVFHHVWPKAKLLHGFEAKFLCHRFTLPS